MAEYELSALPTEIITLILLNNNHRDIINFGATCKRFHKIVTSSDVIWKMLAKKELRVDVYNFINKTKLIWYREVTNYYTIKKNVYAELIAMSPKYYQKITEISLWDIKNFFLIALSNKTSYYYAIVNLQDCIKTGNKHLETNNAEKPYTMTEIYYAKIVVAHLMHTYLAVKWVKLRMNGELPPQIVINYFLQWVDPANMYDDGDVEDMISDMAIKVQTFEDNIKTTFVSSPNGFEREQRVCAGIAHVLNAQHPMRITQEAHLDTVNMLKILETKIGSFLAVCAMYQAVSTRCGINCQLVAFTNHVYLEMQGTSQQRREAYTVDMASGMLRKKRQCPFSRPNQRDDHISKYCPDSLLNNICSTFQFTTGQSKNWHTRNVFDLLYFSAFMGNTGNDCSSYVNLQPFILEKLSKLESLKLNLKYLDDAQTQILRSLSNLNSVTDIIIKQKNNSEGAGPLPPHYVPYHCQFSENYYKEIVVRRRQSNVRYAVGMICRHRNFEYVCVVRGWTPTGRGERVPHPLSADRLYFGRDQPFYKVMALDQSKRYVAQEYLVEIAQPSRLPELEDIIGREFTHFDGFSYVPNEEKRAEYPQDEPVVSVFRSRAALRSQ